MTEDSQLATNHTCVSHASAKLLLSNSPAIQDTNGSGVHRDPASARLHSAWRHSESASIDGESGLAVSLHFAGDHLVSDHAVPQ